MDPHHVLRWFLGGWILLIMFSPLAAVAMPITVLTEATPAEIAAAANEAVAASPMSLPMTPSQKQSLGLLAMVATLGVLAEAAAAAVSNAAVTRGETMAVAKALGMMVAAGGLTAFAGGVAIGVISLGVVISLAALAITVTVVAPAVARGLQQSHPHGHRSVTSGEMTDDMAQAIQNNINPMGRVNLNAQINAQGAPHIQIFSGRGLDASVDENGNITQVTEAPSSGVPSLSLDLSPVDNPSDPGDPGDVGSPGDPGDSGPGPGPDVGDPGDVGDVGLMMAGGPTNAIHEVDVPAIPTLLMFGVGAWALRRRWA